jgi:type 1 fimbria pilin
MNMKKCLFAISLVVFLASLGLAITAEYQSGQSAQKEKATKTVSGEVVSVNSTKNEVVVKDGAGAEVRLQTDKSTKVTKDGKAVSLADVKPSEKVTCEAVETTGGWLAKSIRVSSAKSGL